MILANLTNDFINLVLLGVVLSILLIMLITCRKSEENSKIYYITSKKIYRFFCLKDSYCPCYYLLHKIILKQKNSFFLNRLTILVTKEEYDLLKKGDEIPFMDNTETRSTEIDKKKFNELIEMRRLKKEGFQ